MHPSPTKDPLRTDEFRLIVPVLRRAFDRHSLIPAGAVRRVQDLRLVDLPIVMLEASLMLLNEMIQVAPDHEGLQVARDQTALALEHYRAADHSEDDNPFDLRRGVESDRSTSTAEGDTPADDFHSSAPGMEEPSPEATEPPPETDPQHPSLADSGRPSGGPEAALPTMVVNDPASPPVVDQGELLRRRIAALNRATPAPEGGTSGAGS